MPTLVLIAVQQERRYTNYKKADLRKMCGNHKNSMVSYGQRQGGRWMESRRHAQGTSKALLIFYFLSWVYEYLLLLFNTLHLFFLKKATS